MSDYVDGLTIRIQGYPEGYPLPESLADGMAVRDEIGAEIDRVAVLEEVRAVLRQDQHSYSLREQYGETSWGASGAGLEILIEVGVGVVSSGVATAIIEAVRRAIRRSPLRTEYDSDQAMYRLREVLGVALGCDAEDVTIERFERGGPGWEATARHDGHAYEAEVATDGTVTFHRIPPGS